MNAWLARQLEPVRATRSGVVVVLDRDGLVEIASLNGDVILAADWWCLRAAYERAGRQRDRELPPLVILVAGAVADIPLPWDIEHAAAGIVTVKLPGPPAVRRVLASLDGDDADRTIAAVARIPGDPEAALVRALTGVDVGIGELSPADQLRVAAAVALRPRASGLADMAGRWVQDAIPAALLRVPPETEPLQTAWQGYVRGDPSWASEFDHAKPEVAQLFAVGLLQAVVATAPPSPWANMGVRAPTAEERASELLADRPPVFPMDVAGWESVAAWWGQVRSLIATAPNDLRREAWAVWREIDGAFAQWLRSRFGALLSSAAKWPAAVHRIAHFLARRIRDGDADRVLLIVLDGLGHAQWAHVRERTPLEVVEAGSTFSLIPTYTTVSRQAIFAGELPVSWPDTLWTTQPESRRWREHWVAEGFNDTDVAYHRVKGRLPHDHLGVGDARIIGVVVNAVDDLMHSSELFGDAQLLANLDVWVENGFLLDLVRRATADGIETWITADHGNLECVGTGSVSEGVAIEATGKRLLRYPNRTLREASAAQGIVWDDIPGLPTTADPLLFAAGRTGFTNNRVSVSHGGLSLDEVIVPLARVQA